MSLHAIIKKSSIVVLIWPHTDHMVLKPPARHILRKMGTPPESSSTLYYEDIAFFEIILSLFLSGHPHPLIVKLQTVGLNGCGTYVVN